MAHESTSVYKGPGDPHISGWNLAASLLARERLTGVSVEIIKLLKPTANIDLQDALVEHSAASSEGLSMLYQLSFGRSGGEVYLDYEVREHLFCKNGIRAVVNSHSVVWSPFGLIRTDRSSFRSTSTGGIRKGFDGELVHPTNMDPEVVSTWPDIVANYSAFTLGRAATLYGGLINLRNSIQAGT